MSGSEAWLITCTRTAAFATLCVRFVMCGGLWKRFQSAIAIAQMQQGKCPDRMATRLPPCAKTRRLRLQSLLNIPEQQ